MSADLKGRLHSLDGRLVMQSKELDQMRERLRQAEADRNEAVLRTRWLEEQRQESERHQWATPHVSRRSSDEVMGRRRRRGGIDCVGTRV